MLRYTNLFLLCFSLLIFISCKQNQPADNDNPTNQNDSASAKQPQETIYKGQIQSSGLSKEEMENIGEGNIGFQLVGEQSYFLIGDSSSIKNHWGSCVKIAGNLVMHTPNENTNLYGRKLLKITNIDAFSGSCIYAEGKTEIQADKIETLSGRVKRVRRPAPDIAYDYELVLDNPYIEKNSQYEENMLVKSIMLTADKNQVAQLENAVDKNHSVQIEGAKTYGYAESIVFGVTSVKLAEL